MNQRATSSRGRRTRSACKLIGGRMSNLIPGVLCYTGRSSSSSWWIIIGVDIILNTWSTCSVTSAVQLGNGKSSSTRRTFSPARNKQERVLVKKKRASSTTSRTSEERTRSAKTVEKVPTSSFATTSRTTKLVQNKKILTQKHSIQNHAAQEHEQEEKFLPTGWKGPTHNGIPVVELQIMGTKDEENDQEVIRRKVVELYTHFVHDNGRCAPAATGPHLQGTPAEAGAIEEGDESGRGEGTTNATESAAGEVEATSSDGTGASAAGGHTVDAGGSNETQQADGSTNATTGVVAEPSGTAGGTNNETVTGDGAGGASANPLHPEQNGTNNVTTEEQQAGVSFLAAGREDPPPGGSKIKPKAKQALLAAPASSQAAQTGQGLLAAPASSQAGQDGESIEPQGEPQHVCLPAVCGSRDIQEHLAEESTSSTPEVPLVTRMVLSEKILLPSPLYRKAQCEVEQYHNDNQDLQEPYPTCCEFVYDCLESDIYLDRVVLGVLFEKEKEQTGFSYAHDHIDEAFLFRNETVKNAETGETETTTYARVRVVKNPNFDIAAYGVDNTTMLDVANQPCLIVPPDVSKEYHYQYPDGRTVPAGIRSYDQSMEEKGKSCNWYCMMILGTLLGFLLIFLLVVLFVVIPIKCCCAWCCEVDRQVVRRKSEHLVMGDDGKPDKSLAGRSKSALLVSRGIDPREEALAKEIDGLKKELQDLRSEQQKSMTSAMMNSLAFGSTHEGRKSRNERVSVLKKQLATLTEKQEKMERQRLESSVNILEDGAAFGDAIKNAMKSSGGRSSRKSRSSKRTSQMNKFTFSITSFQTQTYLQCISGGGKQCLVWSIQSPGVKKTDLGDEQTQFRDVEKPFEKRGTTGFADRGLAPQCCWWRCWDDEGVAGWRDHFCGSYQGLASGANVRRTASDGRAKEHGQQPADP
ncbi:unnamed protein product [Amoebophrya sp. A120]|nr:unnamed protein product [Amoebophrya sp. A120]|eukprot:GSA120T00023963001.1